MKKFTKLNETSVEDPNLLGDITGSKLDDVVNKEDEIDQVVTGEVTFIDDEGVQISEPCKFVSRIFESMQMARVYHLQVKTDGSYAKHKALENYYVSIEELIDKLIEVYQGQYEIIEDYDVIKTENRQEEPVQYFIEIVEFIKSTRKLAFLEEDTHLHNIIDEMVALLYRTVYKLKYLK